MTHDDDLFEKTFDQQVHIAGKDITARDITPNRHIPAEIVFEPTGARSARVKAYDAEGNLLFKCDDAKTEGAIPARPVKGEVVFEPSGPAVRVTARDEQHRVLWGYMGSVETVPQIHCLVAVYETLQDMLAEELAKRGLFNPLDGDPVALALAALDEIGQTTKRLRDSLTVIKESDATRQRAMAVARIVADANRQILLEAGSLKGMKTAGDPSRSE